MLGYTLDSHGQTFDCHDMFNTQQCYTIFLWVVLYLSHEKISKKEIKNKLTSRFTTFWRYEISAGQNRRRPKFAQVKIGAEKK